jgi:Zn-dependent protease
MLKIGPLRLHWSLLLGAVLFCAAQPRPALLAGYLAVLLVHLLGHAVAAGRTGVRGFALHGLGGELLLEGDVAPLRRSFIALAGPAAQLALLAAALAVRASPDLYDAFTRRNLVVLLLNLIPIAPLDGKEAWRIFSRLRAARRQTPRELPVSQQVRKEVSSLIEKIRGSTKVR